jgi:PEGA domain
MMPWGIVIALGVLLVLWALYQVTKEAKLLWPLLIGAILTGVGYLGSNRILGTALEGWVWWIPLGIGVALIGWTVYLMSKQMKMLAPLLAGVVLGVIGFGGTQGRFGGEPAALALGSGNGTQVAETNPAMASEPGTVDPNSSPDSSTNPAVPDSSTGSTPTGSTSTDSTPAGTTPNAQTETSQQLEQANRTASEAATGATESTGTSVTDPAPANPTTGTTPNQTTGSTATSTSPGATPTPEASTTSACPCSVKILSNVAGAKITLIKDGKTITGAETPMLIANLEAGTYVVTLEAAGYKTFTGTLDAGKQPELNLTLIKP